MFGEVTKSTIQIVFANSSLAENLDIQGVINQLGMKELGTLSLES